jgi:hypothetical protein
VISLFSKSGIMREGPVPKAYKDIGSFFNKDIEVFLSIGV